MRRVQITTGGKEHDDDSQPASEEPNGDTTTEIPFPKMDIGAPETVNDEMEHTELSKNEETLRFYHPEWLTTASPGATPRRRNSERRRQEVRRGRFSLRR